MIPWIKFLSEFEYLIKFMFIWHKGPEIVSFSGALKIISFLDNWVAINSKILSFMTPLKNMFLFGFL